MNFLLFCCFGSSVAYVFDGAHPSVIKNGKGHFGYSLDLSGDNHLWIGAPKDSVQGEISGSLTKCRIDFNTGSLPQCNKQTYDPIAPDSARDQLMGLAVRGGKFRNDIERDVSIISANFFHTKSDLLDLELRPSI